MIFYSAEILEKSMEAREPSRNRVVVPARQATDRLTESIPLNRFQGFLKVLKYHCCMLFKIWFGLSRVWLTQGELREGMNHLSIGRCC